MDKTHNPLLEAAAPDVNAVVSASAGTGKTWLLVARLLRLLLAGEKPAAILAITFTKKAAAEIRERVTARVREWTQADDATLKEELKQIGAPLKQMQRARDLYETLIYADNDIQIMTFHAFCQDILRRFPLEAQAPAGFEICSEEWDLQDQALNRLYTEATDNAETAQALKTLFETCKGLHNTNTVLRDFLKHRSDWLAYTEKQDHAVQYASEQLSTQLGVKPEEAEQGVVPLNEQTRTQLERHAELLGRNPASTNQGCIDTIEQFLESDEALNFETLDSLLKCFFTQKGSIRKKGLTGKDFTAALGNDFDEFKENFATLAATLSAIHETLKRQRAFRHNRAAYIAGQRLSEIYQELKRTRRQLDFNDLEWLGYRLLNHTQDAQWVQYRLNERIRHILVDEFQDTNPQQWQLLRPLLEEMSAQEGGGSVFIVGDVKQSIYGFRRARPELQQEVERWLVEKMSGKVYTVDTSRRSSPALIDFINRVFEEDGEDALPLTSFRHHDTVQDTPGGVELLPFAEKDKTDDTPAWREILRDEPSGKTDSSARKEAEQVAQRIQQMMSERVAIHDREGGVRALRYGDIVLLMRRRTRLEDYERALSQAGIPHSSTRREKMLGSLEVSDMLALLEFLLNRTHNLRLAQVLRSPLFSVSDEQLIALSQADGDDWFARLERLSDDEVLSHAHAQLGDWIDAAHQLPPHDLLDKIYHAGDVIRRYRSAAPEGEEDEVERHLLELLNYSLDFESGRYPDLTQWVRHVRQHIAHIKDGSATSSAENDDTAPDRVRILTIHQVKGLEAPVVFMIDCGAVKPPSQAHDVLVDWRPDSDRPQCFLFIPTKKLCDEFTQGCLNTWEERNRNEQANLLYVALTRARQYLFVSGNGASKNQRKSDAVDHSNWYKRLYACAEKIRQPAAQPTTVGGGATPHGGDESPEDEPLHKRKRLPEEPQHEIHPNSLVDALPADIKTSHDKDATLRGVVIHYALKWLSENTAEEALHEQLSTAFPQASATQLREWGAYACELIADEHLEDLFDESRYEQVLNEVPIAFMHNGEQHFGIIDRVCVTSDTVWLVDYKTHAVSERYAEKIKAHYTEQMRAYYHGVTQLWPGRTVRTSLLLTESRRLCDYPFEG